MGGAHAETVRISGIARSDSVASDSEPSNDLIARIVVSSFEDGTEEGRVERIAPFVVELDDGAHVRIEVVADTILEPSETSEAPWKDLKGTDGIPDVTLLDDYEVTVTRTTIASGDRVEIIASEPEYSFEEPPGLRSAPVRRLVRATALAVASGDDARDAIERLAEELAGRAAGESQQEPRAGEKRRRRRRRSGPRSNGGYVLAAIALAPALLGVVVRFSPLEVDLFFIALNLFALAASVWGLGRRPMFVRGKNAEDVRGDRSGLIATIAITPPAVFWLLALVDDFSTITPTAPAPSMNASWLTFIATVLSVIGLLALLNRKTIREEARLLRLLLSAPPLPSEGELRATWGSFEGVVRDPTPVTISDGGDRTRDGDGEAVAIAHVIEETVQPGSDPNILVERVLSEGTFFVQSANAPAPVKKRKNKGNKKKGNKGRAMEAAPIYEVFPRDAIWASTLQITTTVVEKKEYRYVQAIPIGGSILVAGRAVRRKDEHEGKFMASDPESLLFFATPEGTTTARAAARALLRTRRVALALVLACGVLAVGLVVYAEPKLPPFNMSGGGAD